MKHLLRLSLPAIIFASSLQAHPGHDGHELVWEYSGGHIHLEPYLWTLALAAVIYVSYRRSKKRDAEE